MRVDLSRYTDLMFWAAYTLAFFGFLRWAEFTTPPAGFSVQIHLTPSDIKVHKKPFPSRMFVQLKSSKTDQFRRGFRLVLAKCDSVLCPIAAMMPYLSCRGPSQGPLFCLEDGSP